MKLFSRFHNASLLNAANAQQCATAADVLGERAGDLQTMVDTLQALVRGHSGDAPERGLCVAEVLREKLAHKGVPENAKATK